MNNERMNFPYFSISRIILMTSHAIFYFLFASLLEPEKYGELSYIIAIAGTASTISIFGLTHSVSIFQAKQNKNLVNQINTIALITTSITAIIIFPINIFASILCFSSSLFLMNQYNLLGLTKHKKYLINAIIKSGLLISTPFILFLILDINGIVIGFALSNSIAALLFIKSTKFSKNNFQEFKSKIKTLTNNYAIDSSIQLVRYIDKLLIVPLLGYTIAGIYQFNLQIFYVLEAIPLSIQMFLLPEESKGKNNEKFIIKILVFSILVTILGIIIIPEIITILFSEYVDGILSLQIILIAIIPQTFVAIFYIKLQSVESTIVGYSAIIRIGTLLVMIAILGPILGLEGLSISVLISSIISCLFLFYIYRRT